MGTGNDQHLYAALDGEIYTEEQCNHAIQTPFHLMTEEDCAIRESMLKETLDILATDRDAFATAWNFHKDREGDEDLAARYQKRHLDLVNQYSRVEQTLQQVEARQLYWKTYPVGADDEPSG